MGTTGSVNQRVCRNVCTSANMQECMHFGERAGVFSLYETARQQGNEP